MAIWISVQRWHFHHVSCPLSESPVKKKNKIWSCKSPFLYEFSGTNEILNSIITLIRNWQLSIGKYQLFAAISTSPPRTFLIHDAAAILWFCRINRGIEYFVLLECGTFIISWRLTSWSSRLLLLTLSCHPMASCWLRRMETKWPFGTSTRSYTLCAVC